MKIIITSKGDPACRIEPLLVEITTNQVHRPEEYPEIVEILANAFHDIAGEPVRVQLLEDVKPWETELII